MASDSQVDVVVLPLLTASARSIGKIPDIPLLLLTPAFLPLLMAPTLQTAMRIDGFKIETIGFGI